MGMPHAPKDYAAALSIPTFGTATPQDGPGKASGALDPLIHALERAVMRMDPARPLQTDP